MKLKRLQLLAYGAPGLPLAMLGLPLAVYLPTYYGETLGLALTGGVLLLARSLDVVTDPLIGWLSDRVRPAAIRRRLCLVIAAPLILAGVHFLANPLTEPPTVISLLLWVSLTYFGWSLATVPYYAWGAELSPSYHEKTRIAASRESFAIIGTLSAISIPVIAGVSEQVGQSLKLLSQVFLVVLPLVILLAIFTVPERPQAASTQRLVDLKWLWSDEPDLRRLLPAYLLNNIGNAIPATLFLLFVSHVLQAEKSSGPLLLLYFVSGVVGLPLWMSVSRRFNKARAWSYSMLFACAVFIWTPWLESGDIVIFALICVLSGLSLGADLALPASMQADIAQRMSRNGNERTGLLFGLWGMLTKLALALSVGIAFPLLQWLGFSPGDNEGEVALAWTYGLLPVLFKLASSALLLSHSFQQDDTTSTEEYDNEKMVFASDSGARNQRLRQHES